MPEIDLLTVGLTTLDIAIHPFVETPEIDHGVLVPTIRLTPAGTAGGTAAIAARLGLKVAIASAVGTDVQGNAVRAALKHEGVDTSLLTTAPDWPTSTTVLPVRDGGQRSTLHMLGASVVSPLSEDIRAAVPSARALHWGGVGYPGLRGKGPALLRLARDSGALTSCDLISPQDSARDELAELLPHVDLFMPSIAEVRFLAETDDLAAAATHFMRLGAGACVFKLGAQGAVMYRADSEIRVPAFAIKPVDTTTCGDSFCAGFITARLRGYDDPACLRFASAVAALVATGVGTFGGLVDFDKTQAFADSAETI